MFFFEKKNQKTFAILAFALRLAYTPKSKSFLVLFFKKELLPSYLAPLGHNTTRSVCRIISKSNMIEKFFT
jgi:hypothetical protein